MTDETDIIVISHAELRAEMAQGEIDLLDVLPAASYATRHIPGATNSNSSGGKGRTVALIQYSGLVLFG